MERCPECGFVYADLPADRIARSLQTVAAQYRSRLGGSGLRVRPAAEVWSPMEYAGHVRDVLRVQHERIVLALRFNRPTFEPMHRDQRVAEGAYGDEDPITLARDIEHAADQLAWLLEDLSTDEWVRSGVYNWPTPTERDVAWIGRHTVHELAHHLLDISRSVDPAVGPASG